VSEEGVEGISDEAKPKDEEGLVEAGGRLSVTSSKHQGTTRGSVRIIHAHDVNIANSLTTL